jgi:hypothetical protein
MTVDMTFCASPNCKNECGRKMEPDQKSFLYEWPNKPVSYAYFCNVPGEPIEQALPRTQIPVSPRAKAC